MKFNIGENGLLTISLAREREKARDRERGRMSTFDFPSRCTRQTLPLLIMND